MSFWQGAFVAILTLFALAIEAAFIALIGWAIARAFSQQGKSAKQPVAIERGSRHYVEANNIRKHPVLLIMAPLFGLVGTAGALLYFIGPFAGKEWGAVLGLSGFGAAVVSAIVLGILFGTDDRDFYM